MPITASYKLIRGHEDCPHQLSLTACSKWSRSWTDQEDGLANAPILEVQRDNLAALVYDDLVYALYDHHRADIESTLHNVKATLKRNATQLHDAVEAQKLCQKIDEILAGRRRFIARTKAESNLTIEEAARL